MATDGAAEFMSNYGRSVLIPIYEISRNYEKRKGGGRRIFLSETEIRIYETQVTKSRNAPATDREVARCRFKGGVSNLS